MSESARRIPGQSIFERLMGRVYSRPAVGVSASFYERFGLTDPWLDDAVVAAHEDEGFFTFLSAAPYYARLRAQRQRAWWSRRRLMNRLAEAAHGPLVARPLDWLVRGAAAMSAPGTSGWLRPSSMASSIASQIDSAVVLLGTQTPVAEEAGRSGRVAERPMDAALGRRGRRRHGPLSELTEDLLVTVPARVRRVVRRLVEDASTLPVEEQVVVARRLGRLVRSPLARLLEPEAQQAAVVADQRPVAVAMARSAAVPTKGLRPVLSRSPSLQTLVFEPQADAAGPVTPPSPQGRVARRAVAAPIERPTSHREAPVSQVAREVRTQRVTGRAGPLEVLRAPSAPEVAPAAPTRQRRRPTRWVAELAVGNEATTETPDARFGLRAVRRAARVHRVDQLATERVVARAVAAVSVGSLGETLISASPVAYADGTAPKRRIRRRVVLPAAAPVEVTAPAERVAARFDAGRRRLASVLAPPTAYVTPAPAEALTPQAAPRPGRRLRGAPVSEAPSAAVERPTAAATTPVRRRPAGVAVPQVVVDRARPDAPSTAASTPPRRRIAALREVEDVSSPTVRAVARASAPAARRAVTRRLVPAPMAHVLPQFGDEAPAGVEPKPGGARRALARAAERPEPRSRRVALAPIPTSYLDTATAPDAIVPEAAPRRAARRAAARADAPQRVDRRGRSLIAASPVDYTATEPVVAPSVAPAPRRRARPSAVEGVAYVTPEAPEVPDLAPTARVARRGDAVAAAAAPPRAVARAGREVLPARVVRTGSTHYAAARLELSGDVDAGAAPETRLAAASRRRARRPMPHVAAWSDFRWLLPEPTVSADVAPPAQRATASGPAVTARVARAVRQVTAAVRASERPDVTPVLIPAARRTIRRAIVQQAPVAERTTGARLEARAAAPRADAKGVFRRTLPIDTPVLLEIVLERAPAETAVERVEKRTEAAPTQPSTRPIRRAVEGTVSTRERAPVAHAAERATWSREKPLRAASETVRTADGRYERSPARVPARFDVAEEQVPVFGLGSPALRRSRRVAPALVPIAQPEAEEAPLVDAPVAGRRARRAPQTTAQPAQRRRDATPTWAHRAATGSSTDVPMAGRAPLPKTGTILGSLAKASTPEDVVRVLVEGGDVLHQAARELPQPAVRLIERIVAVQQEASERASAVRSPETEMLSPRHGHQVREGRPVQQNLYTLRPVRPASSSGVDGVGAGRVMKLANKLLSLIHLAEADKRKAQRQVRMAEEGSQIMRAETAGGAGGGESDGAPNISALKREVVEAVYRELQLLGMRRQEAMNDVWW